MSRKRKTKRYGHPHPGRGGSTITDKMRREAEDLAASGFTQKEIAAELGLACDTARKHLLEEMHNGKRRATARVRGKCLAMAEAGNEGMVRFWLSHQDPEFKNRLALENPDGSAISLPINVYIPENGRAKT